jgi:RNA recognition motif-containing protein
MNIYVGNLPLEMTRDELRDMFLTFGQVMSVTVMNNKYIGSGQPGGYGYVEMLSKSEGEAAIASLSGKKLRDQVINVVEALPLSSKAGADPHDVKHSRSNRIRERRYQNI